MSAVAVPRTLVGATRFERMLLVLAAGLEKRIAERAVRRGRRPTAHYAIRARAADARSDAQALGGIGILPR